MEGQQPASSSSPPQAPQMEEEEDWPSTFPNFLILWILAAHQTVKKTKNSNSKWNMVKHLFLPCQEFIPLIYYNIIGVYTISCGGVCLRLPSNSPNPIFVVVFFFSSFISPLTCRFLQPPPKSLSQPIWPIPPHSPTTFIVLPPPCNIHDTHLLLLSSTTSWSSSRSGRMNRALLQAKAPPFLILPPPPSSFAGVPSENRISPSILLIIIILAIIFFISGLLHLLVRCLLRPPNREPEELDGATALQGQLQQLFHLHDSGVDQSFIDALPVFLYKAIIGGKDPFDCAVCLCEFEPDDKLRLLPKCSHAFHLDCIDTWLLSHSTCPLCRGSLLPDFSPNTSCSPVVLVLESAGESSRDIAGGVAHGGYACSGAGAAPHLDALGEEEGKSEARKLDARGEEEGKSEPGKSVEIEEREEAGAGELPPAPEKVIAVKLGKFRNVGETSSRMDGSGSTTGHVDERRCFSMGSYEYVMDDSSLLQVPIVTLAKKTMSRRSTLSLAPGHRPAMSVCDSHSSRGFNGFGGTSSNHGACGKRESFSVSKIWLRGGRRERVASGESSRRAVSFRFGDEAKTKVGTSTVVCEAVGVSGELAGNEVGSCHSFRSSARAPSFAKRTVLWLAGRQNRVVHSSTSSQV